MNPKPKLGSIDDFQLTIEGAGGYQVPYAGYIWCTIEVPFLPSQKLEVPVLIVPSSEYSLEVPVIIGTNVIDIYNDISHGAKDIPREWQNAFISSQQSKVGTVKSTNKAEIRIEPYETVTVSGFVRKSRNIDSVITEQTPGVSTRIGVCPRVLSLTKAGKSQRVPVRIYNMSAKPINIRPNSDICELHDVKVLRHIDPVVGEKATKVQQHKISVEKVQLPEGINIDDAGITEKQKDQLTQFLSGWKDIFSKDAKDLGKCDLTKHQINLSDNTPFKEPARRIPPALFEEVREHLREMIEAGAIKESKSPYSSNAVIVRKKDGSIRFCVDFRKLNNKTIKDAHAIPRVEESLHILAGSKYFSKLDLRSGYWQVEIEEKDKSKTAFQVGSLGFYEFNRMPFGLCNAPATFQRLMERCMGDLNLSFCLIYLDDIIIYSSTFEEHLERLEAVFERLEQHNLKLKASKCEFFKTKESYLGHVVSEEGVETEREKTEALKSWPIPKNVKDVWAFLGFTGYYRRFIKNYASIARPLNDLLVGHCTNGTKKGKKSKTKSAPFVWEERQQVAFDSLIEKLTSPPILAYADCRLPFKLHTDASCTGLGAILYQNQDGVDRVVSYASRSLKPSEKNYPAHKLEFLALKWAVTEKFHDYLYGAEFEVVTDNNPLTYVFTTAKLDATGQRWLAELSNYNCSISYLSGKQNADADGLSRVHGPETVSTIFPEVLKAAVQANCMSQAEHPYIHTLCAKQSCQIELNISQTTEVSEDVHDGTALSKSDWRIAQSNDKNLQFVIDCIIEGHQPSASEALYKHGDKRFVNDWEKYNLKNGIVYKTGKIGEETINRLCLPSSLQHDIFMAYHNNLGHQGKERTLSLLKRRFYWPGMDRDVQNMIRQCGRCIRRKTAVKKKAELVNITTSSPMELVCIDFLSLEPSKGGHESILVITDHFTRLAQAIPTRNQKATTTARALFDNFFIHYGFPGKLHSDQGANFESKVIKKLCKLAGTVKT